MRIPEWVKKIPDGGWYAPLRTGRLAPEHHEVLLRAGVWFPKVGDDFSFAIKNLHYKRYALLHARPGFGKTTIIRGLAKLYAKEGHRVAVIGPATATRLNAQRSGYPFDAEYNNVIWTSFGKLYKIIHKIDVLLIDEISRFRADLKVAAPVLKRLLPFHAVIGFTGTIIENYTDEFFAEIALIAPVFDWVKRKNYTFILRQFVVGL